MRTLILGAAFALAVTTFEVPQAQAQGAPTLGRPASHGGHGARGHHRRGGIRNDAAARLDRRLEAARLRGNDPSRDIFTGFRWGSPGERVSRRDRFGRGDDFALCRVWRHDLAGEASELMHCGRARQFADDIPGISVIGPNDVGRPVQAAAQPAPAAAPAVRTLDTRRIVRGPGAGASTSFAIRTVGRP